MAVPVPCSNPTHICPRANPPTREAHQCLIWLMARFQPFTSLHPPICVRQTQEHSESHFSYPVRICMRATPLVTMLSKVATAQRTAAIIKTTRQIYERTLPRTIAPQAPNFSMSKSLSIYHTCLATLFSCSMAQYWSIHGVRLPVQQLWHHRRRPFSWHEAISIGCGTRCTSGRPATEIRDGG